MATKSSKGKTAIATKGPRRTSSPRTAKPSQLEAPYAVARELRARIKAEGHPLVQQLYPWFDAMNRDYFEGKLPPCTILLSSTGSPRALGDHTKLDEHGLRYRVRLSPAAARRGPLLLRDVLLHELVHVWCNHVEQEEERGYRGHGPRFAHRCNTISRLMAALHPKERALPPVAARDRRKGSKYNPRRSEPLPDCAQWPVNVRPAGYYPELEQKPERKPKRADVAGDESEGEGPERGRGGRRELVADVVAENRVLRKLLGELERAAQDAVELLDGDDSTYAIGACERLRLALEDVEKG